MQTIPTVPAAVISMPYIKLLDAVSRHYPAAFDVCAWGKKYSAQGLDARDNIALYMCVANTLGIKDEFVNEMMDRGRDDPEIAAAECDLELDPNYMIGVSCNTTRSCMCGIEQDSDDDTVKCYEYIGVSNDQTEDTPVQKDATCLSDALNAQTVHEKTESARDTTSTSITPESAERSVEPLMSKLVLDADAANDTAIVIVIDAD